MSEKIYKHLRQRLKYKPSYKNRKYRLIDRIIKFFRTGKWRSVKKQQLKNVGDRAAYRKAKKGMKHESQI